MTTPNTQIRVSPHGVVVNVLKCDIVVSEFKIQSNYYVPFWTNTYRKGVNSLYPPPHIWRKYNFYCPSTRMTLVFKKKTVMFIRI